MWQEGQCVAGGTVSERRDSVGQKGTVYDSVGQEDGWAAWANLR